MVVVIAVVTENLISSCHRIEAKARGMLNKGLACTDFPDRSRLRQGIARGRAEPVKIKRSLVQWAEKGGKIERKPGGTHQSGPT